VFGVTGPESPILHYSITLFFQYPRQPVDEIDQPKADPWHVGDQESDHGDLKPTNVSCGES
jgi:hypothetical protein